MSLKNKVVILLPGFPKNESDSNCLPYIQDLIQLLTKEISPSQFEIIALHYPFEDGSYYWNDIKVHALGGKNRKGIRKLRIWFKALRTLHQINRHQKIGLIHCFWLNEPAFLAQLHAFFNKTPVLVTIIGQDPLKSNNYLPFLKLQTFKLVGISSFVSAKLVESSKRSVDAVIPLVLNIQNLTLNKSDKTVAYDVIGVGNLSALKNFKLFIEVIENLHVNASINAAIIGSGYQKDALQALINEKKLTTSISLLGEMDRKDIFQIMNSSKVLLHTSNYESQGFAMSEALYFGMSVVSTKVGDNESSLFIDVGHGKAELAHLVEMALNKKDRKRILFYEPKKAIEQYLTIYRELI